MKVSELTGALLDYWVAIASGHLFQSGCLDGLKEIRTNDGAQWLLGYLAIDEMYRNFCPDVEMYSPSTNWAQGGPITDRERICTAFFSTDDDGKEGEWRAGIVDGTGYFASLDLPSSGPTLLVAAMRCYVASKYGEEVPDE